jgi:hypothetical protein
LVYAVFNVVSRRVWSPDRHTRVQQRVATPVGASLLYQTSPPGSFPAIPPTTSHTLNKPSSNDRSGDRNRVGSRLPDCQRINIASPYEKNRYFAAMASR